VLVTCPTSSIPVLGHSASHSAGHSAGHSAEHSAEHSAGHSAQHDAAQLVFSKRRLPILSLINSVTNSVLFLSLLLAYPQTSNQTNQSCMSVVGFSDYLAVIFCDNVINIIIIFRLISTIIDAPFVLLNDSDPVSDCLLATLGGSSLVPTNVQRKRWPVERPSWVKLSVDPADCIPGAHHPSREYSL
jgi:hypothetical protein